jgi:hypothetical protein
MTAIESDTQLSGDVAEVGFASLLGRFASASLSGQLEISGASGGCVDFCEGLVTFAESPTSLDRRCVADSIVDIDDQTWNAAAQSDDPLGSLIDRGLLDVLAVRLVVEEVILDALLDLQLAGSAPFEFKHSSPSGSAHSFDVSSLSDQLADRVAAWDEAVASLGSTTDVVRIAPQIDIADTEVVIDARDWALLAAIDGPSTLAGVISRSGQSTYRAVLGLHHLLSLGAVTRVDEVSN